MAELMRLAGAVRGLVGTGRRSRCEGFTHLIPHAAGHELMGQRRRERTKGAA
jgi:glutaconate CoA-transferase, subunit A